MALRTLRTFKLSRAMQLPLAGGASADVARVYHALDALLGEDAGGRGIGALRARDGAGGAGGSARALASAASAFCGFVSSPAAAGGGGGLLVLTGFPCCLELSPPAETDGLSGAAALCGAAARLGRPQPTNMLYSDRYDLFSGQRPAQVPFHAGRPKMRDILGSIRARNAPGARVMLLSCGPEALINEASELCFEFDFIFHSETFEY